MKSDRFLKMKIYWENFDGIFANSKYRAFFDQVEFQFELKKKK